MLWRRCFRWRSGPRQVTGDTTYGTVENIVAVEDQGIRAYVPLPDFDQRTPFFGAPDFTYDPEQRRVPLPEGHRRSATERQVHRRASWSTRLTRRPATPAR